MVVDPRAGARVADRHDRPLDGISKVIDEGLHGVAAFAEAVEHEHGLAADLRDLAGLPMLLQDRAALFARAGGDDAVAGVEQSPVVALGPPLEPPVVLDPLVGPLDGVGGGAESREPLLPLDGPLGAVGNTTRGIGDTVRGALSQFPLGAPAQAGGK